MLNYALNINDSKRFVKYYQEEKDKLIIHYGDNSTMMVENNETIKDNLDIDLIENEILDSLAFITLISRLEEEFDIEIQPTQVKPDTWRSINSIIELVKSYNG